jgi:hypothetical protein
MVRLAFGELVEFFDSENDPGEGSSNSSDRSSEIISKNEGQLASMRRPQRRAKRVALPRLNTTLSHSAA